MFDYRYHALSLAAVLLALALGVLLGVAIGDSNLVSSAKSGVVHNLQSDLDSAQDHLNTLSEEQRLERTASKALYQAAVHNQLAGHKIGLLFLGATSEQVNNLVRSAVNQAGGQLTSVMALREPLDLTSLAQAAAASPTGTRYATLASEQALVGQLGRRMGIQLIRGGQLITHLQTSLLSSFNGQFGELEGLVVMRAEPEDMSPEQAKAADEFESELIVGATAAGTTAVGVELSTTEHSQVAWYKARNISSVDDLDKLAGQAALAYALAGDHGAWGTRSTADGLLPPLAQTGQ